jgi:hypothetical protein
MNTHQAPLRKGSVFDLAFQELDVLKAALAPILLGDGEHLVSHVEPECLARGADASGELVVVKFLQRFD